MTTTPVDSVAISDEVVEAACFAWLKSLFPPQAKDEEIRSRIRSTDRDHVRYILEAALPAIAALTDTGEEPSEEITPAMIEAARKAVRYHIPEVEARRIYLAMRAAGKGKPDVG